MSTKPKWPYKAAGLNEFYGNPTGANGKLSQAWRDANIVMMPLPYEMRLAWDLSERVKRVAVHRKVAPSLTKILASIWNEARQRIKARAGYDKTTEEYDRLTYSLLEGLGLTLYGGGFNYRVKRGGSTLSTHSWGCAIDLDPARNGMGDTTPAIPLWAVDVFKDEGWIWGGDWKGRNCDGMH